MTTPVDVWTKLVDIKDRESLVVVSQLIKSELTVMEAQVNQLRELNKVLDQRIQRMG